MKKIAFFGGTFDPVHVGHLAIAERLLEMFDLDEFVFIPAFHAPHKPDRPPTSAFHRYAMLCLATEDVDRIKVSPLEVEKGEKRYTIDTLSELREQFPDDRIFFVMGGDSWMDIKTWREWEKVLTITDHIVVSRPGYDLNIDHVGSEISERIVDLRGLKATAGRLEKGCHIYLTDAVEMDISATELRIDLSDGKLDLTTMLSPKVAKYVEKYDLYT
ncbi:MAG: nicotinate-nucleotide adenylyltransferase [Acidobacteria bacterium]|nr:nicotinate-nucleotide adenylyltransferase [Acidobacteriota bacterium]